MKNLYFIITLVLFVIFSFSCDRFPNNEAEWFDKYGKDVKDVSDDPVVLVPRVEWFQGMPQVGFTLDATNDFWSADDININTYYYMDVQSWQQRWYFWKRFTPVEGKYYAAVIFDNFYGHSASPALPGGEVGDGWSDGPDFKYEDGSEIIIPSCVYWDGYKEWYHVYRKAGKMLEPWDSSKGTYIYLYFEISKSFAPAPGKIAFAIIASDYLEK